MSFITYIKKEFIEYTRTSKIILPILFIFFGLLSPITARFTNEILAMVGEQQGVKIVLPDPTYIQSYEQLFKNLYFMMIIIIILMFAGSVAEEKSKGTAILMLTKCLTKMEFILAKVLGAVLLFSLSFAVSAIACIYYTGLLFKVFVNPQILAGILLYWVFGVFIISLTFFCSIIGKSYASAAIYGLIGFFALTATGAIPYVKDYSPAALQGLSLEIIKGAYSMSDAIVPAAITLFLSILAIIGGNLLFSKQEL